MAKSMVDAPKKIKPESGLERRNSTGGAALIFSEPIPIPNYLRASIGSCHDLCKYGSRRHSSAAADQQRRNINNMPKSKTNSRANSSASSMEQRRNKNNSMGPEPKSKTNNSACNARVMSRNNEARKRVSSLPSSESPSARIPTSKTRRSKSVPRKLPIPKSGPEKLLESSECCKKSEHCDETVEEKIINVVENEDDENQKMDSARNHDCGSRKLGLMKREGGVVDEDDIISWKDIRLRRVVSEGDSDNMKRECMRIVVMGKNKVRALVDSFETLITTPD